MSGRERKQERKRGREQRQGRGWGRNKIHKTRTGAGTEMKGAMETGTATETATRTGARMDTGGKKETVTRIKCGGEGLLDPLNQRRSRAEDQALLFHTQHNLSGDRRLRLHVGKSFGRKTRRLYKFVAPRGEPGHRDEREENVSGTGMGTLTGTARGWDWY